MQIKKLIKAGRKKALNALVFRMYNQRVGKGPFKGMIYINQAHGSALSPKIIGTYEKELHPYINEIASNQYERIIDVGCAEGYYAVGLANIYKRKGNKNFKIYAYDINHRAQKALQKLASLHQVDEYVQIKSLCTHEEFNLLKELKTFVICDIEGGELQLLDPLKASNLYNVDMLVELHDGKEFFITNELIRRFEKTHDIKVINHEQRLFQDSPWWLLSRNLRVSIISEGRRKGLKWMYLKVKN